MRFEESLRVSHIHTRCLNRGIALSMTIQDDACLHLIYGEGGGCILEITGTAVGVWIPLRGSLQVHCSGLNRPVHTGDVLVTGIDDDAKAVGHANGRWLAVIGGRRAWSWIQTDISESRTQLLPDLQKAGRELRRAAIATVRATSPLELENKTRALADDVASLQAPLRKAIARCPGRTLARKRQVFLRLQRVRNFIGACCNRDLDNETLARMANLSPHYFLRTFSAVYSETPHSYLVNQRLERARRLLVSSDLAITEIALASGFENRCVFSRAYRKHFGTTALDAKRSAKAEMPVGGI